jgi:hypothetical protein
MNSIFKRHKLLTTFQDDKIKLTNSSSQEECNNERYVIELLCKLQFIFKCLLRLLIDRLLIPRI